MRLAPGHPGISGIEGAFPVSPMHDFLASQIAWMSCVLCVLVVWVTCPVHRSLRLLPLPPSLPPKIALWLHEVGDSKPTPQHTHTLCDSYPVICLPFPVSACVPIPALSSQFCHGRAAERGPSLPGLPPAASFPLSAMDGSQIYLSLLISVFMRG